MTDPAYPHQDRSTFANPTLCLDCGQMFVGATECPTCKEQRRAAERAGSESPSSGRVDATSKAEAKTRTNPTICLDCGQAFLGTTDCPSCHREATEEPSAAADGPESSDDEEREVVDTPTLLGELKELGFDIR